MRFTPDAYVFAIILVLSGDHPVCAQQAASQQATSGEAGFGGSYSSLRPQQKPLIDDWFKRFSAVIQKPIDPAEGYDKLPLSTRTTFNAVTHALLTTKLTDDSGKSLGDSAIELVDKIDDVAGQISGAKADQQFRIYVEMKPGAQEILKQSKEFKRESDNTVYHKGYPTCFRSTGGTPSIQMSFTRDTTRADIDVDYRSSKIPVFLVNGHLTAANSDVRAADNDARHNTQWAGLQNWWRNLLGLPFLEKPESADAAEGRIIPRQPKLKDAKPADAVYDFVNSWLVEQKPYESVPYFAEQAYACMDVGKAEKVDPGMARFVMLRAMQSVNDRLGKVASLSDVTAGVPLTGERAKVINQPHHSQFVLYDVREDLAEEFKCVNKLVS